MSFDFTQVGSQQGGDWDSFRTHLFEVLGL